MLTPALGADAGPLPIFKLFFAAPAAFTAGAVLIPAVISAALCASLLALPW